MSTAHGEQVMLLEEHDQEGARSIEWWVMIFFIASEALIFANLIAAYLYLEIREYSNHFPTWRPQTDYIIPVINTFILLSSSIPVHLAGSGIAKGNQRTLKVGLIVGMI